MGGNPIDIRYSVVKSTGTPITDIEVTSQNGTLLQWHKTPLK
jgi:hypothetical protein